MTDLYSAVENTEGVRPAVQERSLRKRNSLLQVGLQLMQHKTLEDLSIKEICAEAHCTVGSFYSRFADKESYFDAMLAHACDSAIVRAETLFLGGALQDQSGQEVATAIVLFVSRLFEEDYAPVMTEAFLRECRGQVSSTPIDEVGKKFGRVISEVLEPHVDRALHPDPQLAIRFALQVLYSTLINASLRRTIVRIGTPEFNAQLVLLFRQYLGIR
ncbi:MAG: TetR/AcrR family transcriptional regulator [Limnobacter sp.]|nr:TetR/AcrR family transcriptional regulator [Limnobacter sp.]